MPIASNMTLYCHILSDTMKQGDDMQISRLFEIVYILMNKKISTAKELSEHFEVSQRTIYRDIETLCQAGIPICTTKGKGGGITLMEHFVLNKSVLTQQEQNEILSALSSFRATANSDTDQVLHKLGALFGNTEYDWIEVDFSDWSSNEQDKNKFRIIREAILSHTVLSFHYYNSYGQNSQRTIEPYKLMFRGQSWYLYGFCRSKNEARFFKITRIRDLQTEEDVFSVDPVVAKNIPDSYTHNSFSMIPLTFLVDKQMGYRVYDEFPPDHIFKNEDGSFLIRTELQAGSWLTGYLMSFEDHIQLLEPAYLREELLKKYRSALSKNSG